MRYFLIHALVAFAFFAFGQKGFSGSGGKRGDPRGDPRKACSMVFGESSNETAENEVLALLHELSGVKKNNSKKREKNISNRPTYKNLKDMMAIDQVPGHLPNLWRKKIAQFLKRFELEAGGKIEKDSLISKTLLFRLTVRHFRKQKKYDAIFKEFERLMGARSEIEAYDLMMVYIDYKISAKMNAIRDGLSAGELADLWHSRAEELLEIRIDRKSPEASGRNVVLLEFMFQQVTEGHMRGPNDAILETMIEILESKNDPHYTFAELARDYIAQESYISNIDTLEGLESSMQKFDNTVGPE